MLFLGTAVSSSVGCDVLSLTFSVSVCSESDIGSVFSTFGGTASGSSGISFTGPATLGSKLFTMLLLVSNGLKSGSSSLSKTSKLYPFEGTIISSSFSSSGVSSATLVFGPFLSQGFGGNAFLGFFSVLVFPFFSSSTVSFFTFSIFSFPPSSSSAELLLLATIFPLLSSLTADDSMTGEFSSSPTNLPRLRSSTRSRRRWRVCATPSSPSCMRTLEVLQEECPEECLTWEAWVVHQVPELLEELAVLVLPSRRLTNRTEPRRTSQSPQNGIFV